MAKNLFTGLVKITGNNWGQYQSLITGESSTGKLIFADITTEEHVGKYIFANGVEYKVADATNLDELIARVENVSAGLIDLSTFVRETVNASVADLSTRMGAAETYVSEVSTKLNDLSTYVHTEVDGSINRLNSSVSGLEADVVEINTSINDISTRVAAAIDSVVTTSAVANNVATISLTTTTDGGVNDTNAHTFKGDTYVKLTSTDASVNIGINVADVSTATAVGEGLADAYDVQQYVAGQISHLEQALVFRGEITSANAVQLLTTDARQAGDTFIASGGSFTYDGKTIEGGDMVIVKTDSAAGTASEIMVVERSQSGVVTTSETALTTDNIMLGNGNQSVKNSGIAVTDLQTAMANANSAIQAVDASTTTGDYVVVSTTQNASTATVHTAVKTATLADASNGSTGLAIAEDVYTELTKIEEVIAAAQTSMADTLGMETDFSVTWNASSGIPAGSTYKEAIEQLAGHGSSADASVNALETWRNTHVDPSLNAFDTSIINHESRITTLQNASYVNTLTGESAITGGDGNFVAVKIDTSTGDVTLTSELKLAENIYGSTAATGLTTDAFIKDYLAWDVISD